MIYAEATSIRTHCIAAMMARYSLTLFVIATRSLAFAQSTPTLTYQVPSTYTQYLVDGGPPGSIYAYQYTVSSGTQSWAGETAETWRYADIHSTSNITPGTYYGRIAYQFTLDPQSWPWWDTQYMRPRCEFDSATPTTQNSTTPSGLGVVIPNTERFYMWSIYIPTDFHTNQTWATFFQLHAGGDWISGQWPSLAINGNTLFFVAPGGPIDVNGNSAIWTTTLSGRIGTWTDFALHAQWSTTYSGLLELFVNGIKVATQAGPNFYNSSSGQPFYYMKQGYYRDPAISSVDTFFETPVLEAEPVAQCPYDQVMCSGTCVSLESEENCGTCGHRCASGSYCSDGACCSDGKINCCFDGVCRYQALCLRIGC